MNKTKLPFVILLTGFYLFAIEIYAIEKIIRGKVLKAGSLLSVHKGSYNLVKNQLANEIAELDSNEIRVLCKMEGEDNCLPLKYEILSYLEDTHLKPWSLKKIPKYVYAKHFAFNPKVTPDGNMLFWTAYIRTPTYSTQKIWASMKDENGFWGEGFQMESPLNNAQPSAVISALPGGNELFIFGSFGDQKQLEELNKEYNKQLYEASRTSKNKAEFEKKKEQFDQMYNVKKDKIFSRVPLYKSHKIKGGWSEPSPINFPSFYNLYRRPDKPNQEVFGGSTLSSSGKILIYSSQQENTLGKLDLYVSIADENDMFPPGSNLGAVVNSKEEEMAPFLASDDRTLYFSKSGENGTSIHMTKRLGSGWNKWTIPEEISNNLKGVNFFSIPVSYNHWAFISKNSGDLMMTYLPTKYQPDPVILISGIVKGEDGKPLSSSVIIESLTKNKKEGSTVSDPETGKFSLVLPYGERYGFYAEKKGYLPVSKNLDLRKVERKYQEITVNLILPLVKKSSQITINNLFFETKKYDITPESEPELNRLTKVMQENPEIKVQIEGHTDSVGKNKDNMILSYKRANSVANYLIEHGILIDRLVVKGFGESLPVVKNDTAENKRQNRRVVFKILD